MSEYAQRFAENDVDFTILGDLTEIRRPVTSLSQVKSKLAFKAVTRLCPDQRRWRNRTPLTFNFSFALAIGADMIAADVMVRNVISVKPDDTVGDVVNLLLKHDISAVPVVDDQNKVVGILSEADLVHRQEIDTQKAHHWWIEAVLPASKLANEFSKAHGQRVYEVMSAAVVTAAEDTALGDIAALLERHRIKRVPIVRDGKLVGIISRSNLIQALASAMPHADGPTATDRQIRLDLLDRLSHQKWTDFGETNVIVKDGVVHLWGLVYTPAEHKALVALAEEVPGVVSVSDEMIPSY